jgi:cell division protein FtsW
VRAGQCLILIVLALLSLAVVMVTSAALIVGSEETISVSAILLGRHTVLAVLAMLALMAGAHVPVRRLYTNRGYASPIPWIVIGCFVLLLAVHVPGVGREVNGARRWLDFGPIAFQPSELAKWGLLIVLAWHAARRGGAMGRFGIGFVAPMLLVGAICTLIATEDLGTAILIAVVSVCMLIAGGARLWHAAALAPAGVAAFAAFVLQSPYRLDRLRAFLDPFQDPQGIGYHVLQSMTAVSGGGLAGRGLGSSIQKFGYLPEDTNDFIFAIICEELGMIGAVLVVFLYVALIFGALSIVRRTPDPFLRLLGLGIALTIGFQAVINMAVVTGVAPTKGIALPLLSAGGTGWILTAFSIGLLVSIDREGSCQPSAVSCQPET